jgi:hypothetical protein
MKRLNTYFSISDPHPSYADPDPIQDSNPGFEPGNFSRVKYNAIFKIKFNQILHILPQDV